MRTIDPNDHGLNDQPPPTAKPTQAP
jgi:hypothetical protein